MALKNHPKTAKDTCMSARKRFKDINCIFNRHYVPIV